MRIGRADFEAGNIGRVHQAVLDAVPEEEAADEAELRAAYDQVAEESKPPFEKVVENLSYMVGSRRIGDGTFYMRRKPWLSSAEVARHLGVSKRTVQAWGQHGRLLGRRVGGRLRFAAEAVEEWARGGRHCGHGWRGRHWHGHHGVVTTAPTEVWDNEKDAQYDRL